MKKIILLMSMLVIACNLIADKYAGEFLNIGVGVKSRAIGNAFVAVADDPTATYWNSAGIYWCNNLSFNVMHSEEYSGNLKYDALSAVYPVDNTKKIGFLLTRTGISGIPLTELDDPNDTISVHNPPHVYKYVSDADYTGYLAFSSKLYHNLSFGITSKFIYRTIGDIKATGLGLDVGILYKFSEAIQAGINIRDAIGTTIWWKNGETETVTPNIYAGASAGFIFPIIGVPSRLSCQTDIYFEGRKEAAQLSVGKVSFDLHAGLLFDIAPFLSIACGLDREYLTAGAFITYRNYTLQYAFENNPDLNNIHRLSIGVAFFK
ncbi:MAG: hypothetical protein JW794_10305 [Candidatus Cloacimonetes bacterium]|nr:hypothetical protein [Candidatus Cloacimonadota bacterium]